MGCIYKYTFICIIGGAWRCGEQCFLPCLEGGFLGWKGGKAGEGAFVWGRSALLSNLGAGRGWDVYTGLNAAGVDVSFLVQERCSLSRRERRLLRNAADIQWLQ